MHLKYLQNGRHFFRSQCVNSKWPIDAIWQHRSGSTLSQVMAVAWRHQAITWTNADLISVRSSDIHLRPISQRIPLPSVTKISSIIIYLKFHSNLPGANLLTLNVRGPSYLGLTRSISWLLMALRCQDISSHDIDYIEYVGPYLIWGRILSTCVLSMWNNDIECKYIFMFPLKNLARKGLISITDIKC